MQFVFNLRHVASGVFEDVDDEAAGQLLTQPLQLFLQHVCRGQCCKEILNGWWIVKVFFSSSP